MKGRISNRQVVTISQQRKYIKQMVNSTSYASPFLFEQRRLLFPSNSSFFVQTVSGCILCLFICEYYWKSPWKHTLQFYSHRSFVPRFTRGQRILREFFTFQYTHSDKRCLASCPAELEAVYSTFTCVSTCLPVISSIFYDNKSTPSFVLFCFFLSSKGNWFHFSRPKKKRKSIG